MKIKTITPQSLAPVKRENVATTVSRDGCFNVDNLGQIVFSLSLLTLG